MPVGLIPVAERKLNGLINVPRLLRGPAGNGAENPVARHPVPLPGTGEGATVKPPPKMPHAVGVWVTPLASKLRKLPIKLVAVLVCRPISLRFHFAAVLPAILGEAE